MKTLIEDLKKVIKSDSKNIDEYCERLINDYVKEQITKQCAVVRHEQCSIGVIMYRTDLINEIWNN